MAKQRKPQYGLIEPTPGPMYLIEMVQCPEDRSRFIPIECISSFCSTCVQSARCTWPAKKYTVTEVK